MADSPAWVWINRICVIVGTVAAICCAIFAYQAIPASTAVSKLVPSLWGSLMTPLRLALAFGILASGLLTVGIVGMLRHRHPKVIHHHSATVQLRGVSAEGVAGKVAVQTDPEPTEFSKLIREREAAWLRKSEPKTQEEELAALAAMVREWLLPPNAIREFGSNELNKRLGELAAQSDAVHARATECEEKIREIRKTERDYNSVQASAKAIESWRTKLSEAAFKGDEIRRQIHVTQLELQNKIHRELENGTLIATGFRYPNNEDQTPIAASRWRDLAIDFIRYTANRNHDGSVQFTSILIGRPLQNTAPKNVPAAAPTPSTEFTLQGVIERGRRENLEIRTQEALDRRRIEAAKAADYRASDRLNVFSLSTAAQYWAGDRPVEKREDMSQLSVVILGELISAANSGCLKATAASYPEWLLKLGAVVSLGLDIEPGKHDKNSVTTREHLIEYAVKAQEWPPFLFPENR